MFTGIIEGVGTLAAREPIGGDVRFTFNVGNLPFEHVQMGESIAVNGVCLTVIVFDAHSFQADASTEPALVGSPQLVVSPADLPVVEAYLQEELKARGWTVRTDPAIERGGCRAQAATGEVDATVGSRWERVAAALGKVRTW